MKSSLLKTSLVLLLFATIISCKKKTEVTTIIPVTPGVVTSLISLPPGWKLNTTFSAGFPSSVQVYSFDSVFLGAQTKAFCVAFDSRNTAIEFKPVMNTAGRTPTAFSTEEAATNTVYACINGGFFGSGQSFSLVKHNNVVSSANIKALTRVFNGSNTSYFPTRAAFGISSTGAPSVGWIYNVGTGNDLIYSYPAPSPNLINTAPQAVPTATFPTGGTIWNTVSAIGGSPMLIRNNTINITDAEELIVIDNASARARSAIGYNANGIIVLLAVEGGNPPNNGINLANLAAMLKALSCTDAINLDGGGSTSMVVAGNRTVRPSDSGTERSVVSAVVIKRKS
jgi:hypothetical protein